MRYQASPRANACDKCEKAERLYQKPRPDCTTCPSVPPELLPDNQFTWWLYVQLQDQKTGNSLNLTAVKFMFDLYLSDYPIEEQQEVLEKLLLIHRNWKQNG